LGREEIHRYFCWITACVWTTWEPKAGWEIYVKMDVWKIGYNKMSQDSLKYRAFVKKFCTFRFHNEPI
jgi:hypothetical protein